MRGSRYGEGGGGGHDSPATQNDPRGSPATQIALCVGERSEHLATVRCKNLCDSTFFVPVLEQSCLGCYCPFFRDYSG